MLSKIEKVVVGGSITMCYVVVLLFSGTILYGITALSFKIDAGPAHLVFSPEGKLTSKRWVWNKNDYKVEPLTYFVPPDLTITEKRKEVFFANFNSERWNDKESIFLLLKAAQEGGREGFLKEQKRLIEERFNFPAIRQEIKKILQESFPSSVPALIVCSKEYYLLNLYKLKTDRVLRDKGLRPIQMSIEYAVLEGRVLPPFSFSY